MCIYVMNVTMHVILQIPSVFIITIEAGSTLEGNLVIYGPHVT